MRRPNDDRSEQTTRRDISDIVVNNFLFGRKSHCVLIKIA